MKKNILLILFGLFPLFIIGQIPQVFNYQAVVRNIDGEILFNEDVNFLIEILQNGTLIYSEEHFGNSGVTGVVNFKIGEGQNPIPIMGFSLIDWGQGQLQVRITMNGEANPIGLADIVPVPIALYAQKSGADNDWIINEQDVYRLNGRVGVGNSNPTERFVVGDDLGNVTGATSAIVIGNSTSNDFSKLIIGENKNNWGSITWRNSGTSTPHTMLFGTSANGNVRETLSLNRFGRVGIGTTTPSERLVIWEDIGDVTGASASIVLGDNNSGNISKIVFGEDINHWGGLYWSNSNTGKPNSFTFQIKNSPNGNPRDVVTIREDGVTEVEVLQINGGGDIKEDFNSIEELEPGDIVVIDENNPGNICRTNIEYDKKVVGIISGANGINPGLSLSQNDILEGQYPLTMLGRVYVKVTGDVEIGDMLTTSSKPGFAMSIKNYSLAHGCVIGKAMTSNKEGEGFVLVLVNLQ